MKAIKEEREKKNNNINTQICVRHFKPFIFSFRESGEYQRRWWKERHWLAGHCPFFPPAGLGFV